VRIQRGIIIYSATLEYSARSKSIDILLNSYIAMALYCNLYGIRGGKQTPDIDYFETFASVVRYDTFRFLMAKVAAEELDLDHVDVETAFLNLTLQEEIYMQIPDLLREFLSELKGVEDTYLKLNKSLYGLK
jgi:hypothetical protein